MELLRFFVKTIPLVVLLNAVSFGQGFNHFPASGNVGIGTNKPTSNLQLIAPKLNTPIGAFTLDVESFGNLSNAQKSYYFRIRDLSASSTLLYVRGDGNIGMGITDPSAALHLKRNRADLRIENSATNDWAFLTIKGPGQNYWDIAQQGDFDRLEFRPKGGDANRIVFTQGGNVGIGTIDLSSKLHVNVAASNSPIGAMTLDVQSFGNINNAKNSYYFRVRDIGAGSSTPFYIRGDGNIGIGTSDPQYLLHVDGVNNWGQIGIWGKAGADLRLSDPDAGIDLKEAILRNQNGKTYYMSLSDNGGINKTILMLDHQTGDVGIATDKPAAKLDVAGHTIIRRGAGLNDKIILGAGDLNVGLELRSETSKGTPYIDFANDGVTDFDARIILAGDKLLSIESNISVSGETKTKILDITGGSDLSEGFKVNEASGFESEGIHQDIQPGMIVCIDKEKIGELVISNKVYDRTVAGIISGASGVQSGIMMKQNGSVADGNIPVALSGRVCCWADASFGSIEPGDLLTTSASYGHAMKVTDYAKAQGAIIGKAMSSLKEGKGMVLVLVTLQ